MIINCLGKFDCFCLGIYKLFTVFAAWIEPRTQSLRLSFSTFLEGHYRFLGGLQTVIRNRYCSGEDVGLVSIEDLNDMAVLTGERVQDFDHVSAGWQNLRADAGHFKRCAECDQRLSVPIVCRRAWQNEQRD